MLLDQFYSAVEELQKTLRETQRGACEQAGKKIAEAAARGNCVHLFDSGHIINAELIDRAGGLMLYRQFKYKIWLENPVRRRERPGVNTSMQGLAGYALRASGALPGDVMIIGSVSGKSEDVVDLAIEAKKFGVYVIAITSLQYSGAVQSTHPSSKRLFECADLVIDNCAPVGDAMLETEWLPAKICPASGLAAAYLMWSITAVAAEELMRLGKTPSVYKSYNFPGGYEFNAIGQKTYAEEGY